MLFEASPGLYLILDPSLRIVAATNAYLKATASQREEIAGRNVFDVFPDNPGAGSADAVSDSMASFRRVLEHGLTDVLALQRHDLRRATADGAGRDTRYWSVTNSPIFDENGSVAYILHSVEDVTDLGLLQKEAKATTEIAGVLRSRSAQLQGEIAERRRAESALRESEERLKLAVESAGVGTWDLDPISGRLTWSDRCKSVFGLPPTAEVTYESFLCLVHTGDRERVDALVKQALSPTGTGRYDTEYRVVWPDGSEHWVAAAGLALFRHVGGERLASRFIGTVLDITERRRAEESLRASESLLRTLGDNLPEGVLYRFCHTPEGAPYFEFVSAGVERLTGIPASELIRNASASSASIVEEDLDRLCEAILDSRERLAQFEIEVRRKHRVTGEIRWSLMRSTPARQPDGSTQWDGIEIDITKHKEVEEALRRSEALYRAIAKNLPDGLVCVVDLNMRCVCLEGPLALRWGLDKGKFEGRTVLEGVNSELRLSVVSHFRAALAGETASYDTLLSDHHVWSQYAPLRDDQGVVVGAILLALDITPLKVAEAERESLRKELFQAQKMESIGRLAGGVAHDFNNLLTIINGYSSLALEDLQPADPIRPALEQIEQAGLRAGELTRQLLSFSRKQSIEPRAINITELVLDSKRMLGRLIGDDIEIVTDVDPFPLEVRADPNQLLQVLMNLVVNARDAMPTGGCLTLRSFSYHLNQSGIAAFPEAPPGDYAVLEVCDTGIGMNDEIKGRVFEPFFTTKAAGTGTGLGLSTVFGIVRQIGGWITVESQPGMGSAFRVGLPLYYS